MPAIARIGDPISCGDTIAQGSGNVFANGIPVTRINVDYTAGHCFAPVVTTSGASSVLTNNIVTAFVGSPIQPHTCDDNTHGGNVSVGSPNVFVYDGSDPPEAALTGKAAVYAALDSYNQPSIPREVAGVQHDDDPESDLIYVSYRKAALADAEITIPVETISEGTTPPASAPTLVPTDCSDIMSQVGPFPGTFLLSTNFTLSQLTTDTLVSNYTIRSQGGLTEKDIVCNLRNLCNNVLEPMKAMYGVAMVINSGFRHGNGTSQHYKGEACDISFTDTPTSTDSFNRAKQIKDTFAYDQYIYEQNNSTWHHLSFSSSSNRRKVLTKPRGDTYLAGLFRITV